jgi:TetR/AcrR family transcriptional regulator, cholesterol catabolism regulator
MAQQIIDGDGEPLGRRERKKLDVHRRIRRAAAELFQEKGYEAATVEDIAERADVAKGTFFNYFPRKDALLAALAAEMVEGLFEELGPPESWRGTARDQLLNLFLRVGDLMARDPALSKVMIIENMRNFWLRTEQEPLEQEFRDLMRSVLERGRLRGEIAPGVDLVTGVRLLDAAYITTVVEWLKAGAPLSEFRDELTAKFDIIFRGLASPAAASTTGEETG